MIDPQLSEDAPAITGRVLRQFTALSISLLAGLSYWQAVVKHHVWLGAILAAAAVCLGLAGLTRPERIRPIYTSLLALSYPIGRVVSVLLLAAIYYTVFTMLGLFFRLIGRDALQVRRPGRASHWMPKPPVTDLRSYLRQS